MMKNRVIGTTIARLMIGLIVLKDLIIYFIHRDDLFGKYAIMPMMGYRLTLKTLNLEYLRLPFENDVFITALILFGILLGVLFTLGYRIVISGFLLALVLMSLRLRNIYILDGADNVIWTVLPFIAMASSYHLISNKQVNQLGALQDFAPLGVMIQFSLVYLFASLTKLKEPVWQNGEALYYILRVEDFRPSALNVWLTQSVWFVKVNTYFTLAWELAFPFLIWFKRTRNIILMMGVVLHLGIWVLMRIDNFSLVMISLYSVFFFDEEYKALKARITSEDTPFGQRLKNVKKRLKLQD